jgi:hypothetical protein
MTQIEHIISSDSKKKNFLKRETERSYVHAYAREEGTSLCKKEKNQSNPTAWSDGLLILVKLKASFFFLRFFLIYWSATWHYRSIYINIM